MGNNLQVTVVDSLMGTGKTSWAIQKMNDAEPSEKFIFITPFLDEVDRVINSATNRKFIQPQNHNKKSKLANLKTLILKGEDIVSTHALFHRIDESLITLIKAQGYTFILDEVMQVAEKANISKNDLHLLLNNTNANGEPMLIVKDDGFVQWNDEEYTKGQFMHIRRLAESNNLMIYRDDALFWLFPVESFKAFDEIYILTYMFNGQEQKCYYDMFDIEYSYKSVGKTGNKYELVEYIPLNQQDKSQIRDNINIFYSSLKDRTDLNKVGESRTAFSKGHLNRNIEDAHVRQMIKNNALNFYKNKVKANTNDVMWTTIKGDNDKIKNAITPPKVKKQFVEVNCRATNDYADKSVCIYLANRFMNPITKRFYKDNGAIVNEELFALSELLQWLFRSRIRNNEPINVYIPSARMRNLLEAYLDNKL